MRTECRIPAGWLPLLFLTGCLFTGPDCIDENRNLQLEKTFPEGIRIYLSLDEERNAGSPAVTLRRVTWSVSGQLGADVLTGMHLHRGQGGPTATSSSPDSWPFPLTSTTP